MTRYELADLDETFARQRALPATQRLGHVADAVAQHVGIHYNYHTTMDRPLLYRVYASRGGSQMFTFSVHRRDNVFNVSILAEFMIDRRCI